MKTIYITRPTLPPLKDLLPHLETIWENRVLTNGGPFHQQLEAKLAHHLGVSHINLLNNGTSALIIALQALKLSGEIITTPFSFVATAHAIKWAGCEPVFVDIDKDTLNIDPKRIEAAITENTSAILPVHCYGNPCDVDAIQKIADRHHLKVIYDAAHAFGVSLNGRSILDYGDLSTLSFHATKVFNTLEGGAIVSSSQEVKNHIDHLKNFGIIDEHTIEEIGSNGKMNEVCAAIGLVQLEHITAALFNRQLVDKQYRERLNQTQGVRLLRFNGDINNYAYFPIIIEPEYPLSRDQLFEKLKDHQIISRRYFYPLISDFASYKWARQDDLLHAKAMSKKVLCLPIYPDLDRPTIDKICDIISQIK